jgi:hypothetical protein
MNRLIKSAVKAIFSGSVALFFGLGIYTWTESLTASLIVLFLVIILLAFILAVFFD